MGSEVSLCSRWLKISASLLCRRFVGFRFHSITQQRKLIKRVFPSFTCAQVSNSKKESQRNQFVRKLVCNNSHSNLFKIQSHLRILQISFAQKRECMKERGRKLKVHSLKIMFETISHFLAFKFQSINCWIRKKDLFENLAICSRADKNIKLVQNRFFKWSDSFQSNFN